MFASFHFLEEGPVILVIADEAFDSVVQQSLMMIQLFFVFFPKAFSRKK
jgi:hypothetical protein